MCHHTYRLHSNNRRPHSSNGFAVTRMISYGTVKTVIDVLLAAFILVLLSPLLCFVCVMVLADSGLPVLFCQDRLGRDGKPFRMYKFRTMVVGAHSMAPAKEDGSLLTSDDDPRITAAGRWLRRTSLDELPQLLNVIAGQMSLVGPRPDLPWQAQYYSEANRIKLSVKPGITGLAQVSGRNRLSWPERLTLDAEYVSKCSFLMDAAIIWRTVGVWLSGRGVYEQDSSK